MTESASSRDRDEVKRVSNHITRGTLPNPISMSPVALFSPACLRSPESSRPTRFDLPRTKCWYPTLAPLQPSTHFSSPRSISLAVSLVPSCLTPSGDPWPNRAKHGPGGLSIECHFRWPIMDNFGFSDGDDFPNFCSLRAQRNKCNSFPYPISVLNLSSWRLDERNLQSDILSFKLEILI